MGGKNSKTKLGLWLSTFISIIGLLLIVLAAYLFEKTVNPNFNQTLLIFVSVIIAIIPPLLWLSIFYRQDRLNPEPKSLVFKTLLLGAFIQKAVYAPIISLVFPSGNNVFASIGSKMIITIVLVALIQESVKLLAVRYSVYPSKEFDEDIDGIVYGSALGLGFAAMTSIENIIVSGGAMITNVTALVVIETFAHASITGLSCYFLGVSKKDKFNILRLPGALLLSSALNAIAQFLLNAVVRKGFKVNYIIGLIPAALLAIIVFGVLVVISSRHEKEGGDAPGEPLEPKKAFVGILPVWGIMALTIVGGILVSNAASKNKALMVDNFIEIQYPSSWVKYEEDSALFKAADVVKDGGQSFVSVMKTPLKELVNVDTISADEKLQNAAAAWSIRAGRNYRFYQSESGYFLDSKGKETYVINYYYISNSQPGAGDSRKPDIGYGRDILSIVGDDLYIITISSGYDAFILNNNKLGDVSYTFNRY